MKSFYSIAGLGALICTGIASGAELKFGLDFDTIANGSTAGVVFSNAAENPCEGTLGRTSGYANYVPMDEGGYAHRAHGATFTFSNIQGLSVTQGITVSFDAACTDADYGPGVSQWADLISFSIDEQTYKVESGGRAGVMNIFSDGSNVAQVTSSLETDTPLNYQLTLTANSLTMSVYNKSGILLTSKSVEKDFSTASLTMIRGGGTQPKSGWWIDNVAVYDGVLTEDEAKIVAATSGLVQVPAAIPEPATATLSLLALAGLCSRRRRK